MTQWQEEISARDVPQEDLPEVVALLLAHLNVVLVREQTPDYTNYELVPRGVPAIHHPGTSCRKQNPAGMCGCPQGQCARDVPTGGEVKP